MAAGDVTVTVVETPSGTEVDAALTAIRTAVGANGKIGVFAINGRAFCWGIEEA